MERGPATARHRQDRADPITGYHCRVNDSYYGTDRTLTQYFAFYNTQRPHQALGYQTPEHVHSTGVGGGALIVDRFSANDEKSTGKSSTGQRRAAVEVAMSTA
ncbi:hypothetical protein PSP31121_05592 [Pandoraea sputorum]|uniref:Integrase catalytic domain-containing protein n=1 Tax=Pandoraea sputorum TaxID=93222 RepID=A0A5E5BKS3_9BURK|nr:hypothetical protein PSP31121_05592 [Pandoraea sputorum]